ncbi:hypothetical protein CXK97_10520 [Stutzerimonas stutzeri]|nr:hypothetical protein CXK97_10520 [Stutzerimonas stutzeri]
MRYSGGIRIYPALQRGRSTAQREGGWTLVNPGFESRKMVSKFIREPNLRGWWLPCLAVVQLAAAADQDTDGY